MYSKNQHTIRLAGTRFSNTGTPLLIHSPKCNTQKTKYYIHSAVTTAQIAVT